MYSMLLAAMLSAGTTTPEWCKKHRHHLPPPPPPPVCCVPVGCCGGCTGCCGGCTGCCGGCTGCFGFGGGIGGSPAALGSPTPAGFGTVRVTAPLAAQATVVVKLPADAKLYVDGREANLTSDSRSFATPELSSDRDYYYTVKAVADRNGQTLVQSQQVLVRGGRVTRVNLGDLRSARLVSATLDDVAAPAQIKVRLPRSAKLYVNGVPCQSDSFATPTLQPGRDYAYTVKAEILENGEVRSESRRVVFRAGKQVTVDFGDMTVVQAIRR